MKFVVDVVIDLVANNLNQCLLATFLLIKHLLIMGFISIIFPVELLETLKLDDYTYDKCDWLY